VINCLARPEIFAATLVDRRGMMGTNTGDKIGVLRRNFACGNTILLLRAFARTSYKMLSCAAHQVIGFEPANDAMF